MLLPNADRAVVAPEKARDYLLAIGHPTGRGKARFFLSLGFTQAGWPVLVSALRTHAITGDAEIAETNTYGQKFVVRGSLETPSGISAQIVSVWIILRNEDVPRLLTAYPGASP